MRIANSNSRNVVNFSSARATNGSRRHDARRPQRSFARVHSCDTAPPSTGPTQKLWALNRVAKRRRGGSNRYAIGSANFYSRPCDASARAISKSCEFFLEPAAHLNDALFCLKPLLAITIIRLVATARPSTRGAKQVCKYCHKTKVLKKLAEVWFFVAQMIVNTERR